MKLFKFSNYFVLSIFLIQFSGCIGKSELVKSENLMYTCLLEAYPNFISKIANDTLHWRDETKIVFDDKLNKSHDSLISYPDLEDQFYYMYESGNKGFPPVLNSDPGRIRNNQFFMSIYGSTKEQVEDNLVEIKWLPNSGNETVRVTKINGVNKKLALVSMELDRLPLNLKKYVQDIGGTFNWRKISGTNRMSAHSFGIAIDINVSKSNYWKWQTSTGDSIKYQNSIPLEIVEIFEKHGFIWGGKWYHYDTMHFEYRPELISYGFRSTKL